MHSSRMRTGGRASLSSGVSVQGTETLPPWTEWTDASKNITLPRTSFPDNKNSVCSKK